MSIAAAQAADKDSRFAVKPASEYPGSVTQEKVTIAAVPYVREDDVRAAFGKADPARYTVLPVLVVIENKTGKTLRLNLQAEYVDPGGHHVEALSPEEVQYIGAPPRRKDSRMPMPSPVPLPRKKSSGGPLGGWEFQGRAFAARMIPPGEQVSGFFYFQTRLDKGSRFYLTGLSEAGTGKELFYFEVPLTGAPAPERE